MSKEIIIPIQFSYLGGRDYITTTQITHVYFEGAKPWINLYEAKNLSLKILKPILRQGSLILEPSIKAALPENVVVAFSCVIQGHNHRAHIVADKELIVEHRVEAPVDLRKYVLFAGREAKVFDRIPGYSFIEAYVQIGKELILSNTNSVAPRVAGYFFKRIPSFDELPNLSMSIDERVRNDFVVLRLSTPQEYIGNTIVHL